jgi:GMP synthase-like glutamine amidotransferase
MKPVAVFRHAPQVSPGYFTEYLDELAIPWELVAVDEGASIPASPLAFGGLCFMGGPMSVNDPLPWIKPELALIRQAVAAGVPVIGHCLGGQLMSKALGGEVRRNPCKEIGWSEVFAMPTPAARHWLGGATRFPVYQWHGETFSLPPGAERIMTNDACANQAFVLGPHLAMQGHVEMTEAMIHDWNRDWSSEFAQAERLPASVQPPASQYAQLEQKLGAMRQVTRQLYANWVSGLVLR